MELYSEVKGLDYGLLRAELEGFLRDTAGLYERVMDRLARQRLGITLAQLTYADLPYLWRAPGFDDVFTAARTTMPRCCTRRGTPNISRTRRRSSPSSTATSATTPSPRPSPSSSTTS